jgi:radical SAM protein with 4Fe4S-binding SPASM domain
MGIRQVHIMGGEPTLHKDFKHILKLAKIIGFYVVVVSNGSMFRFKGFCDSVSQFVDEIIFSLHGHNDSIHNKITNNPYSFKRIITAIKNIYYRTNIKIGINTVVTNYNINYLESILELISPYNIKRYLLINPLPLGRAKEIFTSITPMLKECIPVFNNLIDKSKKYGINITFAGFPMCILPEYYKYSQDITGEYIIGLKDLKEDELIFEKPPNSPENFKLNWGRIQTKRCLNCKLKYICAGCYKSYIDEFGDKELIPLLELK